MEHILPIVATAISGINAALLGIVWKMLAGRISDMANAIKEEAEERKIAIITEHKERVEKGLRSDEDRAGLRERMNIDYRELMKSLDDMRGDLKAILRDIKTLFYERGNDKG